LRAEHHEAVDDRYLQVLVELRNMGLLKKEDIKRYGFLDELCARFRFLVEWDPSALIHPGRYRDLPLQCAAWNSSIRGFRSTFDAVIRYFPKKKGISLLFTKESTSKTPFQIACKNHGNDKILEVVEGTLIRYSSDTPINIVETLVIAAIDTKIHLDCVYFLLRRQPDVLVQL
jgi:hypothetical protein